MGKELPIWILCALLSVLVFGVATKFGFGPLNVQWHGTIYVLDSLDGIKFLTIFFVIGRSFFLLINLITENYRVLALILSIINGIAGLFVVILFYINMEATFNMRQTQPAMDLSGNILLSVLLLGVLTCQIILQVKMWSRLKVLLTVK